MNPQTPDDLELQLAKMTTWPDKPPHLSRRALAASVSKPALFGRFWNHVRSHPLPSATAACILLVAVASIPLATWQRGKRTVCTAKLGGTAQGFVSYSGGISSLFELGEPEEAAPKAFFSPSRDATPDPADNPQPYWRFSQWNNTYSTSVAGTAASAPAGDRQVIRKVSIEIAAEDVRAEYLKAVHVVSEAQGEYVQDSAVHGSGASAQGNLTLRVAVHRLPEVLDRLRELGQVRSEQANGEDVTEQLVDLEARLRNEQSVEAEMLKLLESRKDAPLAEILQLRDKLSQVRGEIERLTAQRERLGRLVSLATVLVIIRPADAPTQPASSITAYFTDSIAAAWGRALRFLADTLAGLLAVLVGGIIWWVALIAVVVLVLRWRRRVVAEPK